MLPLAKAIISPCRPAILRLGHQGVKGGSFVRQTRNGFAPSFPSYNAMSHWYHSVAVRNRTAAAPSTPGGGTKRTAALLMSMRGLKTKKAAAKRFIKTGKGGLKRGKAFKGHLTSKKSPERKRRLNNKTRLSGHMLKKMNTLIC